jgi:hypothetical protein
VADFSRETHNLIPVDPTELFRAIQKLPLYFVLLRKSPGVCTPEMMGAKDLSVSLEMQNLWILEHI